MNEEHADFAEMRQRQQASVVDLIKSRADSTRSQADDRVLGLVVEGGGMRSAYSAAGAAALDEMGYSGAFDRIYATSAGVMNASYFITNQTLLGLSVYVDDCLSRDFIDVFRPWKVVDVDYVVDHVIQRSKILDVKGLKGSATKLTVALMDSKTAEPCYIEVNQSELDPIEVFRAAMALPVLYNRTVQLGARRFVDAAFTVPFPIEKAIVDGCTDVLVLLTKPLDFVQRPASVMQRMLFAGFAGPRNTSLRQAFRSWHVVDKRCRDLVLRSDDASTGVRVAFICPDATPALLGRMHQNRNAIAMAIERYWNRTVTFMGLPREPYAGSLSKMLSSYT